jgi:hypothetical protein
VRLAATSTQVLVPRLIRQQAHEILRIQVQARRAQLIGQRLHHCIETEPMRLDRYFAVSALQRDLVMIAADFRQRQTFRQNRLRLRKHVTHGRRSRSLVAGHVSSLYRVICPKLAHRCKRARLSLGSLANIF